jgi:CRISPR/Cas system CSM-associated protein Csm3 (group 7 of RAMP superfamily)
MYFGNERPGSIVRWRLCGRLTTRSPLHVGDGGEGNMQERNCEKGFLKQPETTYATVMTDRAGTPVIPGSSIKGALRAWADAHHPNTDLVREVFGGVFESDAGGKSELRGGIVTFHDARLNNVPPPANAAHGLWCGRRSTALIPHVAINPRTRSADEGLLYHVEFIPEGATFEVSFSMQGATPDQRALLLHVLEEAFRSVLRPARLGGHTASGWGEMGWSAPQFETMDPRAWLRGPMRPWHEALTIVGRDKWLEETTGAVRTLQSGYSGRAVRFRVELAFDGAMLVNDPSQACTAKNGEGIVGHAAIRRHDGTVYLPASSVRGALRSQARRIWQTIAADDPTQTLNGNGRQDARRRGEEKELSAFQQLFGASGFRAPLELGDFEIQGEPDVQPQEFVAVDRFTGGAAYGLWRPVFVGEITIRTDRVESARGGGWFWLLLAWTLRDWVEGDGAIGFGRSKGYGGFRASVTACDAGVKEAILLENILRRDEAALTSAILQNWSLSLESFLPTKTEAA